MFASSGCGNARKADPPVPDVSPYLDGLERVFGRVLSLIDAEATSPSRGSFDRSWWCWKFVDFSAPRLQEGLYTLAWLIASPLAPAEARENARLLNQVEGGLRFWANLQHADGSFDEAYPFERSLAATAFTGFYVGSAVERLGDRLSQESRSCAFAAIERGAEWLAANGEHHGILSNHLAAAAAALQVAGDLLGTDRFCKARDRYLGIIYREQSPEGWMLEYGGADPGYQSHGMFYLAEVWRRSRDVGLLDRLRQASDFIAWFVHPDGSIGGEYASRGTKFAYPAGFEILAPTVASAAAIATHLRRTVAAGRGIGPWEADQWNLFPLLNNYLAAAEAAVLLDGAGPLPWHESDARRVFDKAGLVVARGGERLLVAAPGRGGALKVWRIADGRLEYEDCGYALDYHGQPFATQFASPWTSDSGPNGLILSSDCAFQSVPSVRFTPLTFIGFRGFSLSMGRSAAAARWLKQLLVKVLIKKRSQAPGSLRRRISFGVDGHLAVEDAIVGAQAKPAPLARHVPIHMGSARYTDWIDALGAARPCPDLNWRRGVVAHRMVVLDLD